MSEAGDIIGVNIGSVVGTANALGSGPSAFGANFSGKRFGAK
jgi:hypothetical protein